MSAIRHQWRVLCTFDRPGAWQLAVDEALQAGFVAGRKYPVLRLYSWAPPCLSLGYGQPIADIDRAACASMGIDVVRRSTGGRAVFHDQELTYAVVAATDDPIAGGSISQSYRAIATGLLAGLRALGVVATLATGSPAGDAAVRRSGACFAAAARYELLWQGRKLVGSAQSRRAGVLLQHGSIPLAPAGMPVSALLRTPDAPTLNHHLATTTATIADALGHALAPAAAAGPFAAAFAAGLGLTLQPENLTPAETSLADRLCHERYLNPAWTERR